MMVVPRECLEWVLYEFHDTNTAGHPGAEETQRAIQERLTWKSIRQDTRDYVRTCMLCACCNLFPTLRKADQKPRQPLNRWEMVAVDVMGPSPRPPRGKRFLPVVTKAKNIIDLMEIEIFSRYVYPGSILTDNGSQFTGKQWTYACTRWSATPWTTPVYHPQSNPIERRNKELKKVMCLILNVKAHRNWEKDVPGILFNLRNRNNAATGRTPSQMLFGRSAKRSGE